MNVLAIGAHFDDVEVGCGGALACHAARGDSVHVFVATKSGYQDAGGQTVRTDESALSESQTAMDILGIDDLIRGSFDTFKVEFSEALNVEILRVLEANRIDTVYAHWPGDSHHDHQAVGRSAIHCCRRVPRVLLYRSNWYESADSFQGNFYVDISGVWDRKKKAVEAHASEMARTGGSWLAYFENEARNAGTRIGVAYAEVFQVVKWLEP